MFMKISELLTESATDVVARHYKEASEQLDLYYNKEAAQYAQKSRDYYSEYFKDWDNGVAPVFTQPVTKAQPKYDTVPGKDGQQSAGYRGLQYAKARAGMSYDHNVQAPPRKSSISLSSQTQDTTPAVHHGGY